MNCTDFARGVAFGMVSGGAVVWLLTRRSRKRCGGVAGTILRTAGSVIETISRAVGV